MVSSSGARYDKPPLALVNLAHDIVDTTHRPMWVVTESGKIAERVDRLSVVTHKGFLRPRSGGDIRPRLRAGTVRRGRTMVEGESPTWGSRRIASVVVRAELSHEREGDGDRFELFHVFVDAARAAEGGRLDVGEAWRVRKLGITVC